MRNKIAMFCLMLSTVFFLSACSPFTPQNVTDLLRAPAIAPQQVEIQAALSSYLGADEPKFKFPLEGAQRGPLMIEDLDGDGIAEAVIFYSLANASEKSNNAYIAILQEKAEKGWQLVQNREAPQTDIASVELASMFEDGTQQLIVGYSTASRNNKTLLMYSFIDGVLNPMQFEYIYSNYLLGDFTGRGGVDLAIASVSEESLGLVLNFITGKNGSFELQQNTAVPLEKNIDTCVRIHPSIDENGTRLLVVDGLVKDNLVSQILTYSSSGEGFYPREGSAEFAAHTLRYSLALTSRDIDEDGKVEIPAETPYYTLSADKKLSGVEWIEYTEAGAIIKQGGMFDGVRGIYIPLPDEWQKDMNVADGRVKNEWQLQRGKTGAKYFTVRTYAEGENPPAEAFLVPDTTSEYILIADNVPISVKKSIQNGILKLN